MSETVEQTEATVEVPENFFSGKTEPTVIQTLTSDTVIEEKEEKPVVVDKPEAVSATIELEKKEVKPTHTPLGEKMATLFKEGKIDDAYSLYAEQKTLSSLDKMKSEEVIKLSLQYQNKEFTTQDINDLFNERYELPEKPIDDGMDDDEFASKLAKYEKEVQKIESRIARDAKPAITELTKLKQEIVLPDTQIQNVNAEPTQEELDAQKKQVDLFMKSVSNDVKSFNGYETTFKDEEVEIAVAYKMTKEEKAQIEPLVALSGTDAGAFLQGIGWLDDKGNVNTAKITEDLPLILDKSKVFSKIASETGNKRHEASIKSIKNIDYSGVPKSNGDAGPSNQEKQENMVKHFFSV